MIMNLKTANQRRAWQITRIKGIMAHQPLEAFTAHESFLIKQCCRQALTRLGVRPYCDITPLNLLHIMVYTAAMNIRKSGNGICRRVR